MTKLKRRAAEIGELVGATLSDFNVELTRTAGGVSVFVSGAVGIFELSGSCIGVLTHKARLWIIGSGLTLLVYEGRVLEARGRVEDIRLKYGKN